MGLGGILILLLLLVSLIVFIYTLVVTARGWGVLHTILLSFLFVECWVFIVFSAGVHYRRVRATELAHKNRIAAEQAMAQTQTLLYGDYGVSPDALDAVIPVQGRLRRLTADRGRVWRGLNLLQSSPGAYQLEMSVNDRRPSADPDVLAEEPAAGVAAAKQPTSESLPVNTVVYGFSEQMDANGRPIPEYYLGEFSVKQSQAGQVTLQPTSELYTDQQQRISSGAAASWTLYELLPLDSHKTFAAPGSQSTEEETEGRMDEETIRALFANVPDEDGRREKLIDSYLRDGKRASDSDPPETVWVQVNVLKEFEIDVDSKENANATERGYFDALGRSIDSRLKVGESGTVKLTPEMRGKLIVLNQEKAAELIASGTVELVQRVYLRPLNDYEEAFISHVVRDHEVTENIALTKRDTEEIRKANQLGQEMISFRQVENQGLQSDLANFQREVVVLNTAVAEATQEYAAFRALIQQLAQQVQANHAAILGSQSGAVSLNN